MVIKYRQKFFQLGELVFSELRTVVTRCYDQDRAAVSFWELLHEFGRPHGFGVRGGEIGAHRGLRLSEHAKQGREYQQRNAQGDPRATAGCEAIRKGLSVS